MKYNFSLEEIFATILEKTEGIYSYGWKQKKGIRFNDKAGR